MGSLAGVLSLSAMAQNNPIRDPNDQLMREQQEKLRKELLEQNAAGKIQLDAEPAGGAVEDSSFPAGLQTTGPGFAIQEIHATGDSELLSSSHFAKITRPFLGQTLAVEHINVLLDRINKALIQEGYTTSRAYVGGQNLKEGTLAITIVAGRIEKLLFNGAPATDVGAWLVMPMREGDIFRLRDIEQAVDQFNRLRRNNVQVLIKPGETSGGSVVEFVNKEGKAARYNMGLDNQGSSSTGRARVQAGVDVGNILGLMESMTFGLTSSQETNAIYGLVSVPWGYNTISAMASISEYQNLIADTALVYGRSKNFSLSLNRLLARDQNSKTALDISLAKRNSTREVNNYPLSPQSQTSLRVGVNRLTRFDTKLGTGQWSVDVGLSRGIPALGADRDPDDLPKEAARYQFTKLDASASLDRPVGERIIYRGKLSAIWSSRPLYSSEQLFAGGVSSVRAYPESYLGGDQGLVWRNEFALAKTQPLWEGWKGGIRYEPYLFADAAVLKTVSDGHSRSIFGAGAGARLVLQNAFADIQVGRAMKSPTGYQKQGWRVNANLTYQF
ncbi:ShlB/FhaC/HecB family hemolysin secretion/activation protein [Comamonas odontotermitis]|uniref:ShlB/FhaC/HecB family hemolysin secretion/activation protein n=1 Tax=Comamonas odontotermitis TaxID=379895 RepID=UPI003752A1A7